MTEGFKKAVDQVRSQFGLPRAEATAIVQAIAAELDISDLIEAHRATGAGWVTRAQHEFGSPGHIPPPPLVVRDVNGHDYTLAAPMPAAGQYTPPERSVRLVPRF